MTRLQVVVQQAALDSTLKKLETIRGSVARRALRKGVFRAGSETLVSAKVAAPKGRTGQFRRSLSKKDIRYSAQGAYVSIVGQRSRRFTARQVATANRKTGLISKGISGRGQAPPIHFIEKGTKPHAIRAKNKKLLRWNIIAGGVRLRTARVAEAVKHPGTRGTGFIAKTEQRMRARNLRTIRRTIEMELLKLGVP